MEARAANGVKIAEETMRLSFIVLRRDACNGQQPGSSPRVSDRAVGDVFFPPTPRFQRGKNEN